MDQQPIKFKRIEIRTPKWDNNPNKSLTDNQKFRKCLFIIFEDYNGLEYDYMPKWNEIEQINREQGSIELLNKKLCREHHEAKK